MSSLIPSNPLPLASFPPELMVKIASSLEPRTILALIHTSREFSYLFCVFTAGYSHEQDVSDRSYTALQYFVSRGIERAVVHQLAVGADPNALFCEHPKFQSAPLVHAIRFGRASMVARLLRYGACVEDRDYTGCWTNSPNPVRWDNIGFTPLHLALMQPRTNYTRHSGVSEGPGQGATELQQIVKLLLDAGADVAARTNYKHTALHIACGMRDADPVVVSSLIAAGADVGCATPISSYRVLRQDHEFQPIHYAAVAGNTAALQILLTAGVDVEAKTHDGMRAFDLAMLGMHKETFDMLIAAGANTWPRTRGKATRRVLRNPFNLIEDTVKWNELEAWFKLRGWYWRKASLHRWARQEIVPGSVRSKSCGIRGDQEW